MTKNQLFSCVPELNTVEKLLTFFGLEKGLTDTNSFNKLNMKDLNTVEHIDEYKSELARYYIPCKARIYLDIIDDKKSITILRQFIKTHGYTLVSTDKSVQGKKMKNYRLIEIDTTNHMKKSPSKGEILVSFD
tara:strand:+ start:155 stop:553 length:399 start_codon:yes stop_codon:yes gene_type:complete